MYECKRIERRRNETEGLGRRLKKTRIARCVFVYVYTQTEKLSRQEIDCTDTPHKSPCNFASEIEARLHWAMRRKPPLFTLDFSHENTLRY